MSTVRFPSLDLGEGGLRAPGLALGGPGRASGVEVRARQTLTMV